MTSTRGHFLLASPLLRDPNFEHGVVLMVKHDADGAIGVVINKPLDPEVTVAEALGDQFESAASINAPLHQGGPCQGPMMILTTRPGEKSDQVIPGVFFTAAPDDIEAVLDSDHKPCRYIVGYAGWATNQLEGELSEGSWEVVPASKEEIFADTEDLWQRLTRQATLLKFMPPKNIPKDPEMN